jgi:hypothetical protein
MSALPIAFVAALFAVSIMRPAWAFAVVLSMFPLEIVIQSGVPYFVANPWVFNVAVAMLAGVAIVRRILGGESPFANLGSAALVSAWCFFVWGCVSTLWAPPGAEVARLVLTPLPYWIVFIVIAPMMLGRVEELRSVVNALLAVGVFTCLLIIASPQFDFVSGRLGIRLAGGDRTNPLAIGTMGGTLMIVGALTLFTSRSAWGITYRAAAIVLGAGVAILSGSRGQVIFAALTILLCIPISYRLANAKGFLLTSLAALAVGGGLLFAASKFIGSENEDRWRIDELATGGAGRIDNVMELLTAYAESPSHWLQGLGYTAFGTLNTRSGDPYSHVMTVDALAEGGLIGAALLGWIVVTGWRNGRAIAWAVRDLPAERSFASVLLGLSLYYFLLANKQGSMLGTPILFGLLILMGRIRKDLDRREHALADEESAEAPVECPEHVAVAGGA